MATSVVVERPFKVLAGKVESKVPADMFGYQKVRSGAYVGPWRTGNERVPSADGFNTLNIPNIARESTFNGQGSPTVKNSLQKTMRKG